MDGIVVTAKTWQEALEDGLRQLSATIDDVNVKVEDVGGIFRDAKLIISLTEQASRKRERMLARERAERERAAEIERRKFDDRQSQSDRDRQQAKEQSRASQASQNPKQQARQPQAAQQQSKQQVKPQAAQQPKPQQPQAGQPKQQQPQAQPMQPKTYEIAAIMAKMTAELAPSEVPEETVKTVEDFLKNALEKMSLKASFKVSAHGLDLDIEIVTENHNAIIGYHGETIESLEFLATSVANKNGGKFVRVTLDCGGHRAKKLESLIKYADKMAAKCIKTGRKVSLDPMNSQARKIVHAFLSENEQVTTRSEGKEPNRRIVIFCKRSEPQGDGTEKPKTQKPDKNGKKQNKPQRQEVNSQEEKAEEKPVAAPDEPKEELVEETTAPQAEETVKPIEKPAEEPQATEEDAAETTEPAAEEQNSATEEATAQEVQE